MQNAKPPVYTRRAFTAGLAGLPALAAQSSAPAQSPAPLAENRPPGLKEPVPAWPKRPFVLTPEAPPFAESLSFKRKDITPKLRAFPMTRVRLLSGEVRQACEWNRGFMSRLEVPRLLHNFRVNAGLPSSATPYVSRANTFVGHYLSACGLMYASTGDREMKARGDEIVAEFARCQGKRGQGGYLDAGPVDPSGRRVPFYSTHKLMAGLLDMHLHGENKQALEVLAGMADWVDRWTAPKPEAEMQQILNVEYGGMNEVLYNLAAAANEPRWAQTGDRFTKKIFFNPLALNRDELRVLHGNTHIPQVIGAARRYELSSDARFHAVADFFWDTIISAHMYVTGGTTNSERWLGEPHRLAWELNRGTETQECCCAYNMMKLTRHLYEWSGEPRYMDYYERVLFNHRLGAIQPGTGHTTYHLSMSPGAWKTLCTEDKTFWCCTGTGIEEFSKLNNSIYYYDDHGLYVNLFVASEVAWPERRVRLRQETKFPDEARTALLVEAEAPAQWTMNLRVPAWLASAPSVRINGRPFEGTANPGNYLSISRTWKKGDRVELDLPMRLTVEAMPDDPHVQAFRYGPIVLAGELGTAGLTEELISGGDEAPRTTKAPMEVPGFLAAGDDPSRWIKPTGAAPLQFRTAGQAQDVTMSPLNRLWQRFAVYWYVS